MIYKAYIKQNEEGCDYTIACGETVITIDAKDIDDAKEQLYDIIEENYTGERELESCEIYEINNVINYNLKDCYSRISNKEKDDKQKRIDELERIEFERLKQKFK